MNSTVISNIQLNNIFKYYFHGSLTLLKILDRGCKNKFEHKDEKQDLLKLLSTIMQQIFFQFDEKSVMYSNCWKTVNC